MTPHEERLLAILNDPKREERLALAVDPAKMLTLLGFRTGTLSHKDAALKIEVLIPGPEYSVVILPIGMSRTQCTELGEALNRLAVHQHNPNAMKN